MKSLYFYFFIVGFCFSSVSFADDLLNGCHFYQDYNPDFHKVVSYDNEGLKLYREHKIKEAEAHLLTVFWAKNAEPGDYTNEGQVKDHLLTNGPAVVACEKKHLALPTKEQFEALRNCFESDARDSDFLSENGRAQLVSRIPDMANQWFWTASVGKHYPGGAFAFWFQWGVFENDIRATRDSVRCVWR